MMRTGEVSGRRARAGRFRRPVEGLGADENRPGGSPVLSLLHDFLGFLSPISSTFSSYCFSSACTCSLPVSRSSSVISLFFSAVSKCLLPSRRMLRQRHFALLGRLLDARRHLLALLAAHRRHRQANHLAVVVRRHAQIAGPDRLLNVLQAPSGRKAE